MNKEESSLSIITGEEIIEKIFIIREQKVMLYKDLAEMYGVEVKCLNEAVRRNISRFPDHFMFQLNAVEWQNLKSQFVTSSWGGARKLPYAFTEQGVAMLSSVLRFETAIQVNIQIIRVFTQMKRPPLNLPQQRRLENRDIPNTNSYNIKSLDTISSIFLPQWGRIGGGFIL